MKRTAVTIVLSIVFGFLIGFMYCSSRQTTAEWIVNHQQRIVGRLGMPLGRVVKLRGTIGAREPSNEHLEKNVATLYVSHVDDKQMLIPIEYNENEIVFSRTKDFTKTQEAQHIMCIAYESLEFYGDPYAADEIIQGPQIGLYLVLHVAQVKAGL